MSELLMQSWTSYLRTTKHGASFWDVNTVCGELYLSLFVFLWCMLKLLFAEFKLFVNNLAFVTIYCANFIAISLPQGQQEIQQRKILYMGLYLLIWGEAANVRFMPECLCYIFHNVSIFHCSGSVFIVSVDLLCIYVKHRSLLLVY